MTAKVMERILKEVQKRQVSFNDHWQWLFFFSNPLFLFIFSFPPFSAAMEKLYNYQARSLTKMFSFETEQRALPDPVRLKKKQKKGDDEEMIDTEGEMHYTAPSGLGKKEKGGEFHPPLTSTTSFLFFLFSFLFPP